MTYTKNEIMQIKDNLRQVEAYIKTTIIPHLRKGDSIAIKFGMRDHRGDYEYSLSVHENGEIYFRTGGLVIGWNMPDWRKDDDIYDSWMYAVKLLDNWQIAKRLLSSEIEEHKEKHRRIYEFRV